MSKLWIEEGWQSFYTNLAFLLLLFFCLFYISTILKYPYIQSPPIRSPLLPTPPCSHATGGDEVNGTCGQDETSVYDGDTRNWTTVQQWCTQGGGIGACAPSPPLWLNFFHIALKTIWKMPQIAAKLQPNRCQSFGWMLMRLRFTNPGFAPGVQRLGAWAGRGWWIATQKNHEILHKASGEANFLKKFLWTDRIVDERSSGLVGVADGSSGG